MFEDEQICPYTGLRSFTEEESLYFKGRDEDIDQATEQLQRNKFLMLTGASGDGKSSLIYAGIIPNARAGFLKSKYTQWCVADFRPERTPFQNLCKSIARQLDIASPQTVQAELNHGFSAIIDLYRNSKRHLDINSLAWQRADDAGKAAMKREAANLIILVDQFEEFFTNPENYHKGAPSEDASLVLNLLLETARIALEEDLPIYIVFTMRSDYIGQCATFRGLPEFIGFSQYFVPRLNRAQLQQVIEEPATLSGNRISRRLTERLIHDLTEGVDQLPILQHALNQIWHAASNGKEEMDLIHYAMVSGMPGNELPNEQVDRFEQWFESLPAYIKACYHRPNLQNVLDTHTNKLYELAPKYYAQKTGKSVPDEDAKAIIRTAFICLTKIDQSRAVRNRMTLKEITNIIANPNYGVQEVGALLNIFREPGNTFIHPFILDKSGSRQLNETDILDITHESLIRNWVYLGQWAKEEFDNYTISLDFEAQLNRWVESSKSGSFLLSIGQLTYFENWFNTAKPNVHWIARYLPEDIEQDKKLSNAKQVLDNAKEFLKRSARKHVVTRTVIRYGPKRIAAVLALIAVVTLSSFGIREYFLRQNDHVLKDIKAKTFELANEPKLNVEFSVPAISQQLMLGNVTVGEAIDGIRDTMQKIRVATGIATQLVTQGRYEPQKEIFQSLAIADSLLEKMVVPDNNRKLSAGLKLIHDFSVTAGLASFFNDDEALHSLVMRNANRSAHWALQIFKDQSAGFDDIQFLSLALDNGINHKMYTGEEIDQLLKILSPFENKLRTPWVEKNYKKDKVLARGNFSYGPHFNGLYQDLAYLYAAAGNSARALQCVDTLLRYQDGFYQEDYATHIENAGNIAVVFCTYGGQAALDEFVSGYCTRKNIRAEEFYNRLVSRSMVDENGYSNVSFYSGYGQKFSNLNLKFQPDSTLNFFFSKLREEISKIKEPNERNFSLAVINKNQGILQAYKMEISGKSAKESNLLYQEAIRYYQLVKKDYLDQLISVVGRYANDSLSLPRKFLFLYPDYRVPFHLNEPRSGSLFYNSPSFVEYVMDHKLMDELYKNTDELRYFEIWLSAYAACMTDRIFYLRDRMPFGIMDQLASSLEKQNGSQSLDLNILYLILSEQAFDRQESGKGITYLQRVRSDKLLNPFQSGDYNSYAYGFALIGKAVANLSVSNQFDLSYDLLNVFKKEMNRSSLYSCASSHISKKKQSREIAQRLLDSAELEMNRIEKPAVFRPDHLTAGVAIMYLDPGKKSKEAYRMIKNAIAKFAVLSNFSKAYAFHGDLYEALQRAPPLISKGEQSFFLANSVGGFNMANPVKKEWIKFNDNINIFDANDFLVYMNENE